MNEGQESQKRAQARERREVHEAQESRERAQARERVRAAQERERQERQHRASRSQERAERRARAALTRPVSETPRDGDATAPPVASEAERVPARRDTRTDQVATTTREPVMSVQDVIELFNHPLEDGEMRQALRALEADPAWSFVSKEHQDDRLVFGLVHHPSGTTVNVAQERSIVGLWNARI
jgi:hypothetical protein